MSEKKSLAQKLRDHPQKSFRYILAATYVACLVFHLVLIGLTTISHNMYPAWVEYSFLGFAVLYPVTIGFLIFKPKWGLVGFHIIAITQLIAYWGYQQYFGRQDYLVILHIASLAIFWKIEANERRKKTGDQSRHLK